LVLSVMRFTLNAIPDDRHPEMLYQGRRRLACRA
jgi:hypothetical protein